MQKFSTWMIILIDIIFWLLRIVIAYTGAMGMEFLTQPIDLNFEILTIFIALLSIILLVKRKFSGAFIYLIGYWGYFGANLVKNIMHNVEKGNFSDDIITVFLSFIGTLLPVISLLDLSLDKNRQLHPKDKKTDWFYKDDKYDMKKDERADKNNYRTL